MPVMPEDRFADRSRAIEAALLNIEKRFGKGSIMRLGEREISDIPAISTTSLSLDAAIGIGGVPRGRIVKFTARRVPANQHSPCISSPRPNLPAAWRLTLTRNMRWMPTMRPSLA